MSQDKLAWLGDYSLKIFEYKGKENGLPGLGMSLLKLNNDQKLASTAFEMPDYSDLDITPEIKSFAERSKVEECIRIFFYELMLRVHTENNK